MNALLKQNVLLVGERLWNSSARIASFLAAKQLDSGDFPARNYYGKSFSALLWALHGQTYGENVRRALDKLREEMRGELPANFHHEFNRYAILKIAQCDNPVGNVADLLSRERYTGTRVANWTLLRAYCRSHSKSAESRAMARVELFLAQRWFTRDSGLIEDQRGAYTMQYHAFCCALLGELLDGPLAGLRSHRAWFERSVNALTDLILPGGQCNYLGRGSLQSFGYAATVLALAHAYRAFGRREYLQTLEEVLEHLMTFQRADGSLPLVLSGSGEGLPEKFDLLNPAYAGWWSYNNYYDYLPFTGALLALASRVLHSSDEERRKDQAASWRDILRINDPIRVVRTPRYTAVFTLPNQKTWAASLPLPYLETQGRTPFPCYGGEQHQKSIYSKFGLPLPVIETDDGTLAMADARYTWEGGDGFRAELHGITHVRSFTFADAQITVVDRISWRDAIKVCAVRVPRLLLAPDSTLDRANNVVTIDHISVEFDCPVLQEEQLQYSPNGALKCYYAQIDPEALRTRHEVGCQIVIRG